eukprot:c16026_g1_i2.p1 GENE.c16026_g1_i2~~c16026_g1_i2.p1  ORF type:complete len:778 (+),score=148.85 c16026_g1_i2:37-2334(+)
MVFVWVLVGFLTTVSSFEACDKTAVLCDCGGACGVCDCQSCGSCDNCGTCVCCSVPPVDVPGKWREDAAKRAFWFSDKAVPKHLLPNWGNGFVGAQFESENIFIAGVYNGIGVSSHRAAFPSPLRVAPSSPDLLPGSAIAMDFDAGVILKFWKTAHNASITQRTFAHSTLADLIIQEYIVSTEYSAEPLSVTFNDDSWRGSRSDDFDYDDRLLKFDDDQNVLESNWHCLSGSTRQTEDPNVSPARVHVCRNRLGSITIPSRTSKTVQLIAHVQATTDPADYENVRQGALLDFLYHLSEPQPYYDTHTNRMASLWQSGVDVSATDRNELRRIIKSSLWNILISVRDGVALSTSPGGLPNSCYQGHVFWDTEQFIWPNLRLFFPSLARECLLYRFDRIPAAANKATNGGYKGLQFPWESALSGSEASPASSTGKYQVHISGDVSVAVWQFYQSTRDKEFLREFGWPILEGVADYYASRVTRATTGYSLSDVMGVDEQHFPIDNSAYVNAVAIESFRNAIKAAEILGISIASRSKLWTEIIDGLPLPFDFRGQKYLDYANMRPGSNGLGVILLNYPLNVTMSTTVRSNNLEFYSKQWPNANSMYWWAFSVGWNALGDKDRADLYFDKITQRNVFGPFGIWSEDPGGHGCPNFITGAGAFLQAIWAGYAGLRISDNELTFSNSRPLPGTTVLFLKRISYHGSVFSVEIRERYITLLLAPDLPSAVSSLFVSADHKPAQRLTRVRLTLDLPTTVTVTSRSRREQARGNEL